MEYSKESSKREVHTDKCQPFETRTVLNKQPNFTPQGIENVEQMKPKFSGRKEITEIGAEVNITETEKTIEKTNKSVLTEPSGMPLSFLRSCVCVCVCM